MSPWLNSETPREPIRHSGVSVKKVLDRLTGEVVDEVRRMIFNMVDTLQPTENSNGSNVTEEEACSLLDQGCLSVLFSANNTPAFWTLGGLQMDSAISRLAVSDPTTPLAPGLQVSRQETVGVLRSQACTTHPSLLIYVCGDSLRMARWR